MIKSIYLNLIKQVISITIVIIFIGNVYVTPAQKDKNYIKDSDKSKIINQILLMRDFVDTEQEQNDVEIYLSTQNLPADSSKLVQKVRGIKIILLSEKEINTKTKYGFEYYKFDEFDTTRKYVNVKFSAIWENSTAGEGTNNGTIYECRRRNKNWNCKVKGFSLGRS